MQSTSSQLGGTGDTEDRTFHRSSAPARLLSHHELDQEYLYRLWKAMRISEKYVQMWANALTELQDEAPCDYFVRLMQQNPALVNAF